MYVGVGKGAGPEEGLLLAPCGSRGVAVVVPASQDLGSEDGTFWSGRPGSLCNCSNCQPLYECATNTHKPGSVLVF